MKTRGLLVAALAAMLFAGFVPAAWADKGDMRIQFGAASSSPTDDLSEPGETVELDSAVGFQASFEYMATDLIGVEPRISSTGHDVTVEGSGVPEFDLGEIDLLALTANVNFHLRRGAKIDLFVGPTIGYAFWDDLESEIFATSFPADDEFIYGVNFGLDMPFGEQRWGFSAGLNYLLTDVSLEGSAVEPDLGVDPMQLNVGVSYRF
jgi:outer membrane protein W